MGITRIIKIDGRDVRFRASAAIPRLYRERFGRDIFSDLRQIGEVDPDEPVAGSSALTLFEDIAYIMAKFDAGDHRPVAGEPQDLCGIKKKLHRTDREVTTPLMLLRAVQMGITIRDMDLITIGTLLDMYTERLNDTFEYDEVATQEMFDLF